MNYKKLIKYNEFVKLNLKNRFVYNKTKKRVNQLLFRVSRLVLFFFKFFIVVIKPFLKKIDKQKCDILVWGNSANHLKRSARVWELLQEKGYKVEFFIPGNDFLTKYALKFKINYDLKVPHQVFFHHVFAKYVVQKYDFKILCDYHNYEVASAFIKKELNQTQKSVFIPHGKIRNSYRHSCFTFDYYLVFGESSIEKIKENKIRLGNTKLVKTGSAFIPENFNLEICRNFKNILFFSNWAISHHPESNRGFKIVLEWAKRNPDYNLFIRLHPLEDGKYVSEQTKNLKNIIVQDKSLTLKQSLENVSLTIATASNASIEAAMLNRPSLVALDRDYNPLSSDVYESDSNFYLENYFPKRARNSSELSERINQIYSNYDFYLQKCKEYVKYHLEYTNNSSEVIAETIEKFYNNKSNFKFVEINDNLSL